MQDRSSVFAGTRAQVNRRQALRTASAGFGYLALASMLGNGRGATARAAAADQPVSGPLAPKQSHFPAKAKRIIFLFMQGSISQMDTWEYKPRVQEDDGKVGPGGGTVTGSKFKFAQHGETGTWVRSFIRTCRSMSMICASSAVCTPTRPRTPRR